MSIKTHIYYSLLAMLAMVLAGTALAGTYSVTSTADSGDGTCDGTCTLRDAIIAANANPGADTIDFSAIVLPTDTVPVTISLTSGLPLITDTLMMDASITETRVLPGNPTRRPGVELDLDLAASIAGPTFAFYPDGLNFSGPAASGSVVRGFIINGLNGSSHQYCLLANENPDPLSTPANPFPRQGYCGMPISIFAANGIVIAGNYLNTDADGLTLVGMGPSAVEIVDGSDNQIGGPAVDDRNVILSDLLPHLFATMIRPWVFGWSEPAFGAPKKANNNQIVGNYIGAAADGTPLNPIARGVWMALWNIEDDSAFGAGRFGWGVQCDDQASDPCEMIGNVVSGNVINNAGGPSSVALFGPAEFTEVSDNLIFNTTAAFPVGGPYGRIEVFGTSLATPGFPGVSNPVPGEPMDVFISNNRLGVDGDGLPTGWSVYGIGVGEGQNILIADNTISGTLFDAIWIGSPFSRSIPQNASISRNSLFDNGFGNEVFGETLNLGINLGRDDGVTANDAKDVDEGPNGLQNFPELTWAKDKQGQLRVHGHLNSETGKSYRIEFFANDVVNPSGHGEGARYLGSIDVSTNHGGNAEFDTAESLGTEIGSEKVDLGDFITATATELCTPIPSEGECLFGTGATSEFSLAVEVTQ